MLLFLYSIVSCAAAMLKPNFPTSNTTRCETKATLIFDACRVDARWGNAGGSNRRHIETVSNPNTTIQTNSTHLMGAGVRAGVAI